MKILIDARLYGLENTGIGRYTINLVNELIKVDHTDNYIILLRKEYFNRLNFPNNWKKVLADYPHYSFSEQIRLPFLLYSLRPDLVHFLHLNVPILYWKKYILTVHDVLIVTQSGLDTSTLPFYWYWIKRLVLPAVFMNALKLSERILVPSKAVKGELSNLYSVNPRKINAIYEGVSLESSLKRRSEPKEHFLYVGNAYPHKNLDKAIEALGLLNQNSKEKYKLFLVSARNTFTKRLETKIEDLNANDYVKILGFVSDQELKRLYQDSIAFVFPSLSEGFGLPGVEALVLGTPLLASDIPVFREVFADNALFFDPKDANSIKQSMEKVISLNKPERERMIGKGQKFAKRYSWSKMAQETLVVYKSI